MDSGLSQVNSVLGSETTLKAICSDCGEDFQVNSQGALESRMERILERVLDSPMD